MPTVFDSALPVVQQTAEGNVYGAIPTYWYTGPELALAASRYHFILGNLSNGSPNPYLVVRILHLGLKPVSTAANTSLGGYWTLRKRLAPTTAPGSLSESYYSLDSQDTPPSSDVQIGANPATSPAGGTLIPYDDLIPVDGEEIHAGTLDLPGASLVRPFGGRALFSWKDIFPGKPIVIRSNEYLELQQGATAGTGNVIINCLFTIETSLSGAA